MLFATLLAAGVFASGPQESFDLKVIPVGNFGGFRALVGCDFSPDDGLCLLDTASHRSILKTKLPMSRTVSREPIVGIGFTMDCTVEEAPKARIGKRIIPNFRYLHCPEFPVSASPLVGSSDLTDEPVLFSFSQNALLWGVPKPESEISTKAWPLSGVQRWILLNARIGDSEEFTAAWDTGAPVTLVDHRFVAQNPGLFLPSDIPPTERMKQRGGVPYRLARPLMVGGLSIGKGYVHAYDLEGIFGARRGGADLLIGMNHIGGFDWWIDLDKGEMVVRTIRIRTTSD